MRNCNETAFGVHPDAKESAFLKTALHRAAEHDREVRRVRGRHPERAVHCSTDDATRLE